MSENAVIKEKGSGASFSATNLKMIAVICMLIDHATAAIYGNLVSIGAIYTGAEISIPFFNRTMAPEVLIYYVLRMIGRVSFPLFCFFIVEGFFHTRSRLKYAIRLLIFAIISEVPFDLALFGYWVHSSYQNVYFTLLIGLLAIWGIDSLQKFMTDKFVNICVKVLACTIPTGYIAYQIVISTDLTENTVTADIVFRLSWLILAIIMLVTFLVLSKRGEAERASHLAITFTITGLGMAAADFFCTDYAAMGILTIIIMYVYRKAYGEQKRWLGMLVGIIILSVSMPTELPALVDVLLIRKYNGTRGKGLKFFFYAFYPAHLIILAVICTMIGLIAPFGM